MRAHRDPADQRGLLECVVDEGDPPRNGAGERSRMIRDASRIIRRISTLRPCWWIFWAPACLPRPMTIILQSPLSTLPVNPVWGFDPVDDHDAVGLARVAVEVDGKAGGRGAHAMTSIEDRMGARTVSSVIPLLASTSTWPAAVAPRGSPCREPRKLGARLAERGRDLADRHRLVRDAAAAAGDRDPLAGGGRRRGRAPPRGGSRPRRPPPAGGRSSAGPG